MLSSGWASPVDSAEQLAALREFCKEMKAPMKAIISQVKETIAVRTILCTL